MLAKNDSPERGFNFGSVWLAESARIDRQSQFGSDVFLQITKTFDHPFGHHLAIGTSERKRLRQGVA